MAVSNSVTQQLKQAETNIAVLQVEFSNLEEKLDDLKTDISVVRTDITTKHEATTKLLKEFQAENTKSHETMAKRIAVLERWRWMLMGAGVLIGALGSKHLDALMSLL